MEDLTEELKNLHEEVEQLKAVVAINTRFLPPAFFRRWYTVFFILFLVIAVTVIFMAVGFPRLISNLSYIADVYEGSEVIIE